MTDRGQFVAAIEADPDSDLPRLAFADWLDDHGDRLRAEFIRVQCEHAARPTDALKRREGELLDALAAVWPAELIGDWTPSDLYPEQKQPFDQYRDHFKRGFLTGLMPEAAEFADWAARHHAAGEPVVDAILRYWPGSGPDPDWPALVANPALRLVACVSGVLLAELFASTHFRRLSVVVTSSPAVVGPLAACPADFRLRRLAILSGPAGTVWNPGDVARVLAGSPRFATLERLSLDGIEFRTAEWRALAASAHLPPTLDLLGPDRAAVRSRSAVGRLLQNRFPGPAGGERPV